MPNCAGVSYTVPVLVVVSGSTDITAQRSGGYGTPCTHATHFVPSPMKAQSISSDRTLGWSGQSRFSGSCLSSTVLSVALEPGGRGIPKDGRKSAKGGFLSVFTVFGGSRRANSNEGKDGGDKSISSEMGGREGWTLSPHRALC